MNREEEDGAEAKGRQAATKTPGRKKKQTAMHTYTKESRMNEGGVRVTTTVPPLERSPPPPPRVGRYR